MRFLLTFFLFFTTFLISSELNLTFEEKNYIENKKTIKVHTETSWYPFSYLKNDKPSGYIHDLKLLFSKKTGLELEIVPSSYDDAVNNLLNGKIDLMFDLGKKDEYSDKLIFNKNHTIFYYEGIISQKGYKNLEELNNKTVGYIAGLDNHSNQYKNVKFKAFDNDEEMITALLKGQINAAIDSYITLKYFINNMNIVNDVLKLNFLPTDIQDKSSYYHIATQKSNQILMNIVNKTITKNDIETIQEKWGFIKSSSNSNLANNLTYEEKAFLKNKKVLKTRVENNWKPYSFMENGKANGYLHDILRTFAKKANLKLEVQELNFDDSIEALKDKKIDIFIDTDLENIKNAPIEISSMPIYLYSEVIFSKDGYKELKTLKNKKVGYIEGMEYTLKEFKDLIFIPFANEKDLIYSILNDEIDLALGELQSVKYYSNNIPSATLLKIYPRIIKNDYSYGYPAVHNDNKILLEIFEKLITKKDIDFLKSKWGIAAQINSKEEISSLTFEEEEYLNTKKVSMFVQDTIIIH